VQVDFLGQKFGHVLKKTSDLEQPRKLEIWGQLEGDSGSEVDLAMWQNNKVKVSHLSLFGSLRSQWLFPAEEHPLGTEKYAGLAQDNCTLCGGW
jgi:hypothetical protein